MKIAHATPMMAFPLALAAILAVQLARPAEAWAASRSLAALWHFDNATSTTALDSSGNGNTGTLTNGASFTPIAKFGASAVSFDGVDDFVEVPDSTSLDIPGSLTVEAWVSGSAFNIPGVNTILSKENSTSPLNANYSFHVLNGKLFFALTFSGSATLSSGSGGCDAEQCFAAGSTPVSTGVYHHVAAVYDDSSKTMIVYLDGTPDGSATFATTASPATNASPVLIGARGAFGGSPFNGNIDEVRIWNRVLGGNEILASAQAGLRALWHFNEAFSIQTLEDSSGYNNNGIRGGSTAVEPSDPSTTAGPTNFGNALHFDGGDSVQVPNSSTLEPAHVTVEARVRASGLPGSFKYILSKGGTGDVAASYALDTASEGGLRFYIFNGTTFDSSPNASPTAVWDGNWHHVAGTFDGSFIRLYVDGAEVGTGTSTALSIGYSLADTNDVFIGDYSPGCISCGDHHFTGDIDEIHLWARALSAAEIAFLAGPNAGELVVPGATSQSLISGAVFGSLWNYGGPASPRRAMGLEFIASNDDGSATIDSPVATPPCATDRGSTPGTSTLGGLVGCQIGMGGKSALITGEQINVTVSGRTVPSRTLHVDVNLSDGVRLGANFQWR